MPGSMPATSQLEWLVYAGSPEFPQQRLRLLQIGRVEPLGEPAVDRGQEVAGFGAAALVMKQPGEAHTGTQFPDFGLLLPGDAEGLAIEFLGTIPIPLPQQQLAFLPLQLRREPALAGLLDEPK